MAEVAVWMRCTRGVQKLQMAGIPLSESHDMSALPPMMQVLCTGSASCLLPLHDRTIIRESRKQRLPAKEGARSGLRFISHIHVMPPQHTQERLFYTSCSAIRSKKSFLLMGTSTAFSQHNAPRYDIG